MVPLYAILICITMIFKPWWPGDQPWKNAIWIPQGGTLYEREFVQNLVSGWNWIGHFGKYHNNLCLSPQILHNHCFQFLLGLTMVPRENKSNAYSKFEETNKEYYGNFRSGLFSFDYGWDRALFFWTYARQLGVRGRRCSLESRWRRRGNTSWCAVEKVQRRAWRIALGQKTE